MESKEREQKDKQGLYRIKEIALAYDQLGVATISTIKIREDCFDHMRDLLNSKLTKYEEISKDSFSVKTLGYTFIFKKDNKKRVKEKVLSSNIDYGQIVADAYDKEKIRKILMEHDSEGYMSRD